MQTERKFSATWSLVNREWNGSVNGGLITTLLFAGTALLAVAAYLIGVVFKGVYSFPIWPAAILGGITLFWIWISLPMAALRVAHRERLARLDLIAEREVPAMHGLISTFALIDWGDIGDKDWQTLGEARWKATNREPQLFNLCVEITNSGADSRARQWNFSARRQNGQPIELVPTKKKWARPISWPDLQYLTLDEVQDEYIKPKRTYRVFIPLECCDLVIIGPDIPKIRESFRASFKDDMGVEIICERLGDGLDVPKLGVDTQLEERGD